MIKGEEIYNYTTDVTQINSIYNIYIYILTDSHYARANMENMPF